MQIFIASSQESLGVARKLAAMLEAFPGQDIQVRLWNDPDIFIPNELTFESLEKVAHKVDAALFVFAEDDRIWYRGHALKSVRDNVLFEYGLFSGVLSRKRTAIIRCGDPKTPSDLAGLNCMVYDPRKPNHLWEIIEAWLINAYAYIEPEIQGSISMMSLLDALQYGIKAGSIDTLKIFAISTNFSVRALRMTPAFKAKDAYVILRRYEDSDPYYNKNMEDLISNSVNSWKKLQEKQNIANLHIGYFNYQPDEGFYLIDDRILIFGILNTYLADNSVEFNQNVVVVKNTSNVGRSIINLYASRFEHLKENFLNHE